MVFSFIKKTVALASADRIAQAASSQEAFDNGKGTAFSVPEIIELYFQKYGSTQKKFDCHSSPKFYIGYVKIPGKNEFLSVILIQPKGSIAVSFYPDAIYSNDLFGVMAKKAFADKIAMGLIQSLNKSGTGFEENTSSPEPSQILPLQSTQQAAVAKPELQISFVLKAAESEFNRRATGLFNAAKNDVANDDDAILAMADISMLRGPIAIASLNEGCTLETYENALNELSHIEKKWERWALKS
ncbi:hypothetical protein [Sodalis sp. dw_96]|uniref:hypothetical protein n=1 Tax=Sodalis sp. dw_96 TaxID=2719794 RepID=UPI001BD2BC33|nr:hypothetical protein [Sodalis sp. dw_96]